MEETIEVVPISHKQPHNLSLNKGQVELYKYLQSTKSSGGKIHRSEIMRIYLDHVVSKKNHRRGKVMYEEQLNRNATQWMNLCIAIYASRGYVTLNFNFEADDIDKLHTVNKWKSIQ